MNMKLTLLVEDKFLKMEHLVHVSIWIPGRWPWSKGRHVCRECGVEMNAIAQA